MKKHILSIIALFVMTFSASAQVDLIEAIGDVDGVTAININKTMLSLMPKEALASENKEVAFLYDKLENMQMFMAEDEAIGKKLETDIAKELKKASYKLSQKIEEDGTKAIIYYRTYPKDITSVVIVYKEEANTVAVMMNGTFTLEELAELGFEGVK